MIVGTEKGLREAGGPVKRVVRVVKMLDGWKGGRPWVRLDVGCVRSKSLKTTSGAKSKHQFLSSREQEVISLGAGLRMVWDAVIEVLHSSKNTHQAVRDYCREDHCREVDHAVKSKAPTPTPNRKETVTEKLLNCLMWITLPQAQNPSIRSSVAHF